MSGLGFAMMFKVSASFLRSLDRAGKTKLVAPSSAPPVPGSHLSPYSAKHNHRKPESPGEDPIVMERGEREREALNNNTITTAHTYRVPSVYGSVLSITHTLTDLMSSKMLFQ